MIGFKKLGTLKVDQTSCYSYLFLGYWGLCVINESFDLQPECVPPVHPNTIRCHHLIWLVGIRHPSEKYAQVKFVKLEIFRK